MHVIPCLTYREMAVRVAVYELFVHGTYVLGLDLRILLKIASPGKS